MLVLQDAQQMLALGNGFKKCQNGANFAVLFLKYCLVSRSDLCYAHRGRVVSGKHAGSDCLLV